MKTYPENNNRPLVVFISLFILLTLTSLTIAFQYYKDYPKETLYFISILTAIAITGFLAFYAWQQRNITGAVAFMLLELSQCSLAAAEGLSMFSHTQPQALFWFNMRFIGLASGPVFLFIFALEYTGRKEWLSWRLLSLMLAIPFITQVILWSNSLHGLWVRQDVGFHQSGPFWIANTTARIPGIWFQIHSTYSLLLMLIGTILIFIFAWRQAREFRWQALLLTSGVIIPLMISLIPTFNLNPSAKFNPIVQGMAIGAVLIAAAVFRFQFLKKTPAGKLDAITKSLGAESIRSLIVFVFIFMLMATGLAITGFVSYQNYETQFRRQIENQLSAISELKVNELNDIRKGWLEDADSIYRNAVFGALAQRALENPADAQAREQIQAWLKTIQNYSYGRVFLLDGQSVERFSSPTPPNPTDTHLKDEVNKIFHSKQINFLDFHQDSETGKPHLEILIPILAGKDAGQPVGVLVLLINPETNLYPLINQWPVPSGTSETLLFRRDGSDVLYLNNIKFEENSALNLRIPLEKTEIPAVMAVLGKTGIVEGVDYRGVPVLADIRAVPNSPWFLVAKMDMAEVYGPIRERAWELLLLFGVLVISAGGGLGAIWRQQRLQYYREQYETSESLRESEEKYRILIEQASDGIFIADASTKYIEVNPSGCAMLGYTREELLTKKITDLIPPEDMGTAPPRLDILRQGKSLLTERHLVRKDGSLLPVEISARMFPDGRFQSIIRDTTERKQSEIVLRASEEKYRALFQNAQVGMYRSKLDGSAILAVNRKMCEIFGYNEEEMLGNPATIRWAHPEARNQMVSELREAGSLHDYQVDILTKSGQLRTCSVSAQIFVERSYLEGSVIDITERKLAEGAIKETERVKTELLEKLNDAQHIAMIGSWEWDLLTNQVWWSDETYRIFGVSPQDFVPSFEANGKFIHPDDFEIYGKAFDQSLQTGEPLNIDLRLIAGDGQVKQCYSKGQIIHDDAGRQVRFVGTIMDITDRRQAEDALYESEARYRLLVDQAPYGISIHQNGQVVFVNPACVSLMLAKSADELLGKPISSFVAPENRDATLDRVMRMLKGEVGLYPIEDRYVRLDGSTIQVEVIAAPFIFKGRPAIQIIAQDITERKQAEEALHESEEKFKYVFDNSVFGKSLTLPSGEINVNKAFCEMLGYTKEELTSRKWQEISHPDDTDLTQNIINSLLSGEKESVRFTKRYIHKNGSVVWTDVGTALRRDKDGNPLYFMTSISDITQRIHSEEELKKTELAKTELLEKLNEAQHFAMIGSWEWDLQTNLVWWSEQTYRIFGVAPQDFIPSFEAIKNYIHADDLDGYNQALEHSLQQSEPFEFEVRLVLADGSLKYTVSKGKVIFDDSGNPKRFIGTIMDITERKKTEDLFFNIQRKYQILTDRIADQFFGMDNSLRYTYWNKTSERETGIAAEDALGKSLQEVFPDTAGSQVEQFFLDALKTQKPATLYYDYSLQGQARFFEIVCYPSPEGLSVFSKDISERKLADIALKASELRFRVAAENLTDIIYEWDLKDRVDWYGDIDGMMGFRTGEFPRTLSGWAERLHAEDKDRVRAAIDDQLVKAIPYNIEYRVRNRNEEWRWWSARGVTVKDEQGESSQWIGSITDITERKQAETALRESEERLRLAVSAGRMGTWDRNFLTERLNWSVECKAMFGLGPETGMNDERFMQALHPEDQAPTDQAIREALEKKTDFDMEFRVIWADGTIHWVASQGHGYYDERGQAIHMAGLTLDITGRKQAEEALKSSEKKYRQLHESLMDGFVSVAMDGKFLECNEIYRNMLGYSADELAQLTYVDLTPEKWHAYEADVVQNQIIKRGYSDIYEKEYRRKDGTIFPVELHTVLALDEQGNPLNMWAITRDITERKQAVKQLSDYAEKLEEMVDERTRELREIQEQLVRQERLATLGQLAGSIGHELRNPLGVISNAIYFLKMAQPDASDKVKEYLTIIENEARTSDKIVTDLLDFARIKSVDREVVSASDLIRQTLERFPAPASIEVSLEVPPDLPLVFADPHHVIQILGNLTVNACQAMDSEGGCMEIFAAAHEDMVSIAVRDHGSGISPENMTKLFQPLFTTKIKGIGLGLAVSRKLAEANGGRIEVESEAGVGSTFTVWLPVQQ